MSERTALRILLHGADATILPDWAALPPRARNRIIVNATQALATVLVADQPCICLIEDLQWADEASAAAMEGLKVLVEKHPFVVFATVRSNGVPTWFESRTPVMLRLGPLPDETGRALLDRLLGTSPRLDDLKQRILRHTGSMPLFIEEVCRGLAEGGTLTGRSGAYELAGPVGELGVPLTVQGVIASRIDRLPISDKRLLQVAAAIGPRASTQFLQAVSALPDAVFTRALMALFAGAMLVPAEADADRPASYAFPHELVRRVAYDAVLGPSRTSLHGQILDLLEQGTADGAAIGELAGSLVHHALLSSQWARAARHATTIARQSFAQSALPDAMRNYETAMQAVDRLPQSPAREAQAIDLRIEARSAYANIGKVKRWLEHVQIDHCLPVAEMPDLLRRLVAAPAGRPPPVRPLVASPRSACAPPRLTSAARLPRRSRRACWRQTRRSVPAIPAGSPTPATVSAKPTTSPAAIGTRSQRSRWRNAHSWRTGPCRRWAAPPCRRDCCAA